MKRLCYIIFLLMALYACKKEKNEGQTTIEPPVTLAQQNLLLVGKWKIISAASKYSMNTDTLYTWNIPVSESYTQFKADSQVVRSQVYQVDNKTDTSSMAAKYRIISRDDKFYLDILYRALEESEIVLLNKSTLIIQRSGPLAYYMIGDKQYPCDKQTYSETYKRVP